MLIPSLYTTPIIDNPSLSRRVNANSQLDYKPNKSRRKLIKKGEC